MSRNSSRVQTVGEPQAQPASQPQETVRRTANTEFVDLPSGGRFYPQGHPLHNQEVVEIRFMTARDEDVLTSQTLLNKGMALDKFIQGIMVNQNINVDDLLIGDKSAIMIAARITGYGPEYEVKINCPSCDAEVDHEFDLSDYNKYFIADESEGTPFELNQNGQFVAQLPASGQEVTVRLLTARDEKRIQKQAEMRAKNKLAESATTDLLKSIITSIGGVTQPDEVGAMVLDLPARDSLFIRKNYAKLVPKVEMKENFECMYCGEASDMEVPLGAGFFWPG